MNIRCPADNKPTQLVIFCVHLYVHSRNMILARLGDMPQAYWPATEQHMVPTDPTASA